MPSRQRSAWTLLVLFVLLWVDQVRGQTTVFFQGFESNAVACTGENWPYSGGDRNSETARTGSWSLRVGRLGGSNSATFAQRNITGMEGVQLQVYHRVRPGSGPGLDTREGAVMLVQLDGGAWTPIARVGGFGDHNYPWTALVGGSAAASSGCNVHQAPNPVVYNVPAGTGTIAFRVVSIRVGSSNCALYNNYMNAGSPPANYDRTDEGFFIDDLLLTTTSNPLPLVWTGEESVDWFDCRNWNLGLVPNATNPVLVQQSAVRNCVVGFGVPGNAQCASLTQRTNTVTNRQLTVQNGSTLDIGGPMLVQRQVAGVALTTSVIGGSMLSAASVSMEGTTSNAFEAVLRCEQTGSTVSVETDITIGAGGLLDLEGPGTNGGRLELGRDFFNLRDESHFEEVNSTVALVGNGPQTISIANGTEVFHDLQLQKTGGDAVLLSPVEVSSTLDLQAGRMFTNSTDLLTLRAGAVSANASDLSFVHGPLRKVGLAPFTFPVGKGNSLRTCAVSDISGTVMDAFTGEYFPESARELPFANVTDPGLDHVSDCEYWLIDRSGGMPNATVTLSWDTPQSCGVTSLPDLRVAYWDVAIWRDRGNNVALGTDNSGIIPTDVPQNLFGAFTLASSSWMNPLPISLLHFSARPDAGQVRLDWHTATELDNDHFTVERSADGISFHDLLHVPGAGTSLLPLNYSAWDERPLPGVSYYRLRQTDFDGTRTWSDAVTVRIEKPGALHVWPVGDQLQVRHPFPAEAMLELFDAAGRLVLRRQAGQEGQLGLDPGTRSPGVYLLRAIHGERVLVSRFFW